MPRRPRCTSGLRKAAWLLAAEELEVRLSHVEALLDCRLSPRAKPAVHDERRVGPNKLIEHPLQGLDGVARLPARYAWHNDGRCGGRRRRRAKSMGDLRKNCLRR